MCDPVTLGVTAAAVGGGSAILGFQGAQQQAKSSRVAANMNYAQDYNADADQLSQVGAQKSENAVSALIERAKAQGRISAAAGSMGLADATTGALGNAAGFEVGRDASIENLNSDNQRQEVIRNMGSSDASRRSKIRAAQGPGAASLVLGLAKAGLQGAGAYQSAGGKF